MNEFGIRQLHPLFVGEVAGIDLHRPVAQLPLAELQAAIDRHAVLVFRGAPIDQDQQLAFAASFGVLETSGIIRTGRKFRLHEKLADISNVDENERILDAGDRRRMSNLGNLLWHTDSSFKETPANTRFCMPMSCRAKVAKPSSSTCARHTMRCPTRPRSKSKDWRLSIRSSSRERK